jgi:hypothetical protein
MSMALSPQRINAVREVIVSNLEHERLIISRDAFTELY